MVNLPKHSLRVVYELVISVPNADMNAAIASLITLDIYSPSLMWYSVAHTYLIEEATQDEQHLFSHVLPGNRVGAHYKEMTKVASDISSHVVYANPTTGERRPMGGDWIHKTLDADTETAPPIDEERFLHC